MKYMIELIAARRLAEAIRLLPLSRIISDAKEELSPQELRMLESMLEAGTERNLERQNNSEADNRNNEIAANSLVKILSR